MATHSSVLSWRIPGTGEPGGLLSMGSHRVGHDWSDLAAAAAGLGHFTFYSSQYPALRTRPPSLHYLLKFRTWICTSFSHQNIESICLLFTLHFLIPAHRIGCFAGRIMLWGYIMSSMGIDFLSFFPFLVQCCHIDLRSQAHITRSIPWRAKQCIAS